MEKRLYRDELNKKVGGVCAGLADYLNIDVTIIRVIFVIALVMKGVGVVPYLVLWIVLPKKPYFADPNINVDYTVPPTDPYNPFANNFSGFGKSTGAPFAPQPKKSSGFGLVIGVALVIFGSYFLLDEFNILPDLDLHRLWPVVLILAGVSVVLSGRKKAWEKEDWHKTEPQDAEVISEEKAEAKPNDNNPIV